MGAIQIQLVLPSLGLKGDYQRENAAVALEAFFLYMEGPEMARQVPHVHSKNGPTLTQNLSGRRGEPQPIAPLFLDKQLQHHPTKDPQQLSCPS